MAEAVLTANKVLVKDKKKRDQLIQKGFGERKERELVLDLKEALYMLEKKKLKIENVKGEKFGFDELMNYASRREKGFYNSFLVYADLRDRGFVVKTGFKFGFDFRVYPRGKKMGEAHTKWVVHVSTQDERIARHELSRMVRLAGNIRATLLQAVVDSEDDINYYETSRITP